MTSLSRFIVVPALLLITPVQADVNLRLGDGVNLHAVNGESRVESDVFDIRSPITLANGTQQIVVNVTAELGRNRDDSVLEHSDSFVLLFQAKDQDLRLHAPEIETRNQLEAFNNRPSWKLQDGKGNDVDFKWDVLEKRGFQLVRNYDNELAEFNRDGGSDAALMARQTAPASLVSSSRSISSGDVAEDQDVVRQMLRYWYLKADDNTKSEMKRWINAGE